MHRPALWCESGNGHSGIDQIRQSVLVVYQQANKAFFVYGFAKNERANISDKELKALKLLATQ